MQNSQIQKGFTLIKLMIVVAIIGILASVALPSYSQYSNRAAFAEAVLAVSVYKTAILLSAEVGRFTSTDDIQEDTNGIPDQINRHETTHGVHVHKGEIKVTWRKDGSALDNVNYTLRAQNVTPPIEWVEGGNCLTKGFC